MRLCSIPGCGKKHHGKGLCLYHYGKEWYKNNREEKLKKNREWKKRYPEKVKKINIIYFKNISNRFDQAKRLTKNKKCDWNLCLEVFEGLINIGCYYCEGYFGCLKEETGIGLDRRDNSIRDYNIKKCSSMLWNL